MLANGDFFSGFFGALIILMAIAGFGGAGWLVFKSREFWQYLWQEACQSRVAMVWRLADTAVDHGMSSLKGWAVTAIVFSWGLVFGLFQAFGRVYRRVLWHVCAVTLFMVVAPFLVFYTAKVSWQFVFGVLSVGAVLGVVCAPLAGGYYFRLRGVATAIGASLLSIVGGAWSTAMLMALLIVMSSD